MKRIVLLRFPLNVPPESVQRSAEMAAHRLGDGFVVLPMIDNIEKAEVEIVYDPNFPREANNA